MDERSDGAALRAAVRRIMPFLLLIGELALSRLMPPLEHFLNTLGRIQPFTGAPAW